MSPEERALRLHYMAFLALSCPLNLFRAGTPYQTAWLVPSLPLTYSGSKPPRSYHLVPQFVRCIGCGTVHSNTLGQPSPVLQACGSCELQPLSASYYLVTQQLSCAGWPHLTREDMLAYNQLCRKIPATAHLTQQASTELAHLTGILL